MRIAKLYNYDAVSQCRPADHLKDAIKAWSRIARPSTALAIAQQPIEKCAIEYIKNRLDTNSMYVVPSELAIRAASTSPTSMSSVDADSAVEAFLGPRGHARLLVGDVVFKVVNSRPEARKVFRASGEERSLSHIGVRAFRPGRRGGSERVVEI